MSRWEILPSFSHKLQNWPTWSKGSAESKMSKWRNWKTWNRSTRRSEKSQLTTRDPGSLNTRPWGQAGKWTNLSSFLPRTAKTKSTNMASQAVRHRYFSFRRSNFRSWLKTAWKRFRNFFTMKWSTKEPSMSSGSTRTPKTAWILIAQLSTKPWKRKRRTLLSK